MFVSDRALEHLEKTAYSVGFGPRSDYPHRGKSPISAADWKGDSVAACVFADFKNASEYLNRSLNELVALSSGLKGEIFEIEGGSRIAMYVAVITAVDLTHLSEKTGLASPE